MNIDTLEYAFFQENFEIFQFKFKTYGCGKWAKTYDEAHELAKEAVLKKCMEENPHLAFQPTKKILNLPDEIPMNGADFLDKSLKEVSDRQYFKRLNPLDPNSYVKVEPEKINKGSIEEQIQACTEISFDPVKGILSFEIMAKMNDKLLKVYEERLAQLQRSHKSINQLKKQQKA